MTERGIFIELVESQADGYVSIDQLQEPVTMHPGRIKITGSRSKKSWKIGDQVDVEISNIDLDKRQIDLRLILDNG